MDEQPITHKMIADSHWLEMTPDQQARYRVIENILSTFSPHDRFMVETHLLLAIRAREDVDDGVISSLRLAAGLQ